MQEGDATIPIYDEQGDCIGEKVRGEVDKKHDILKSVSILLFNRKRELFVVRIAENDSLYPGVFGCSAAGLVRHDETAEDAAVRTLQRELNINSTLHYHGERFVDLNGVKRFMNVFSATMPGLREKIAVNPDDAIEGFWAVLEKLDKSKCMPTLLKALQIINIK